MKRIDYCYDCVKLPDCDYFIRRVFDESPCVEFEIKPDIAKNTEQQLQPDTYGAG